MAKSRRQRRLVTLRSGPPKRLKQGTPRPRVNLHKARASWFRARVTWPMREAPEATLAAERRRVARKLPNARLAGAWQQVGPINIGGRSTSILCHPADADTLLIGAAGGGVWASSDGGQTWRPQWRDGARSVAAEHGLLRHGRSEPVGRLLPRRRRLPIDQRRHDVAQVGDVGRDGPAAPHRRGRRGPVRPPARTRRRGGVRPRVGHRRLRWAVRDDQRRPDLAA